MPTTISSGSASTHLQRLDRAIESHPIWTERRGPVRASAYLIVDCGPVERRQRLGVTDSCHIVAATEYDIITVTRCSE